MTDIPEVPGHEILRVEVGSTVHGIGIGSDDTDLMSVTIEPRNTITGLENFEHFTWRTAEKDERSGPDDIDFVAYGLKKFLRLACKGNPSILVMLFAPTSHIRMCDGFGVELIAMREHILSYQCKGRFLGYLNGQRQRVEQGRSAKKGGLREGREAKWASHMVRLGFQAHELLTTGHMSLPMQPNQAEICRSIKRGELDLNAALVMSEELEKRISEIKVEDSPLSEHPNVEEIENWMHSVYMREFSTVT